VHRVVDELRGDRGRALALVAIRDDPRQVHERHVLILRRLPIPETISIRGTGNAAVLPVVGPRERHEDGRRPAGARIRDHLSQVPAERAHGLVLARDDVVDFLGLRADARNGAARAQRSGGTGRFLVERAGVVVTELDDHEIPGAHFGEHAFPVPFGDEGAAAASPARRVHDPQPPFIEERLQHRTPALLVLGIGLVRRGGGIAGDEEFRHGPCHGRNACRENERTRSKRGAQHPAR
jgi:hypothetical protein